MILQMSTISDSSQEASNAGVNNGVTPASSPKIFMKEMPDLQPAPIFRSSPGLLKPGSSSAEQAQKRRSSSRSIKRKKFDDELVESSLIKTSRARPQNVTFPMLSPAVCLSSPNLVSAPNFVTSTTPSVTDVTPALPVEKKRPPRPPQKRIKKPKNNQNNMTKEVSRWKPTDDLTLILSVQQAHDLETLYRAVKFSSKFTLKEVQERWYALLYDPTVSKASVFAMKQLSPEVISQIQSKVIFNAEEEKLIASVSSTQGNLEMFQKLLDSNASVFLPSRTAKVLHSHWTLMKQYNLLHDQTAQQPIPVENLLSFSDTEDILNESELQELRDSAFDEGTKSSSSEVKRVENEIPKSVIVDCVTGVTVSEFDSKTLAVLTGRVVRFLIQSREVSLGRSARESNVDIDLSLEGPAWKISRKQGVIKMDNNGDFFIINEGKKPIFIDGKPVISGSKSKINNGCAIEITILRFNFAINQETISTMKSKSS